MLGAAKVEYLVLAALITLTAVPSLESLGSTTRENLCDVSAKSFDINSDGQLTSLDVDAFWSFTQNSGIPDLLLDFNCDGVMNNDDFMILTEACSCAADESG